MLTLESLDRQSRATRSRVQCCQLVPRCSSPPLMYAYSNSAFVPDDVSPYQNGFVNSANSSFTSTDTGCSVGGTSTDTRNRPPGGSVSSNATAAAGSGKRRTQVSNYIRRRSAQISSSLRSFSQISQVLEILMHARHAMGSAKSYINGNVCVFYCTTRIWPQASVPLAPERKGTISM